MIMIDRNTYAGAVANLRELLPKLGRAEFRAYGYARQLRRYRVAMRALCLDPSLGPPR